MKELWQLFCCFFRLGAVSFGGGYAMLPLLRREMTERRGWLGEEELADCFAVGQCTPGIIAVNTATYVGYKRRGVPGAIAATVGVVLPGALIILLLASVLERFSALAMVQKAFAGLRVGVLVLVVNTVARMARSSVRDVPAALLAAAALVCVLVWNVSPVWIVLGGGLAGLLLRGRKEADGS